MEFNYEFNDSIYSELSTALKDQLKDVYGKDNSKSEKEQETKEIINSFDYYVGSPAHMHMLLDNKKYFGFGVTFNDKGNFMGVVRSSNSPTKK